MTLMLTDFTKNILRLYFTGTGRWANANYKFILMKKGDKELYYKSSTASSSTGRALPYEALLALTDSTFRDVSVWFNSDVAKFADITQNTTSKSSSDAGAVTPYLIQPIDKNEIDVNDIDNLDYFSTNSTIYFKNPSSLKWLISSVNGLGTIKITATNSSTTDSVTVNRLVILSKRVPENPTYVYYKPDAQSTPTQVKLFCMPLAYVDIDPVTVAPGETYVFQIHIPAIEMQVEEEEETT